MRAARLLAVMMALGLCASCDSANDVETGDLSVVVITTGGTLDPDGYTLTVEGVEGSLAVGTTDHQVFEEVEVGDYVVTLDGLAENCQLAGDNPRTVSITVDEPTEVVFEITCVTPNPCAKQAPTAAKRIDFVAPRPFFTGCRVYGDDPPAVVGL